VTRTGRPAVSNWARAAAALMLIIVGFQLALALGVPWGAAAWGGAYPGTLPGALRLASLVSAAIWIAVAFLLSQPVLAPAWRGRFLAVLIGANLLSVLLNLASRSWPERLLWTPFALIQLVLVTQARRTESRTWQPVG
jgi:hypothetical protein